jgi:hypothetical protein
VLGRQSALISLAVPVAAIAIAGSSSAAFAMAINDLSHEDENHAHADGAAASEAVDHDDSSVEETGGLGGLAESHGGHGVHILPEHQATVAIAESTMHEPENTQPVTAENLRFAEQFLAEARAGTEKYKDVAAAEADGYFKITQDIPLIGAHYLKPGSEGLDPAHPSILLYTENEAGGWDLAGLSYTLPKTPGDDTPPETELGGLAGWHYHTNLCFLQGGSATIAMDQAHCDGGLHVPETGWLLHVWAWLDSPEGVFDHANSLLQ